MLKVDIENISVSVQGSFKELLSGVSFSIPQNSVYTILGKNGSGKSTLIKAMTCLLDSRFYRIRGRIEWKEQNLLTSQTDDLLKVREKEIRYVLQDSLNSLDPLKKVKYYFENTNCNTDHIVELIAEFQLPDYRSISEKHPYELSGGMLQRLNFVLALAAEPQLIILDEPTSALDSVNAILFIKAVKSYVKEKSNSVLIVTQDLHFAEKLSDKIGLLNDRTLTEFVDTNTFFNSDDPRFAALLEAYKELSR